MTMTFTSSFMVMLASTVNSLLFFGLGFGAAWWLWWRGKMLIKVDRKWYVCKRVDDARMEKVRELGEVKVQ